MDMPTLAVALASLAQPSQHARLIQLRAPVEGLVVERFHGQEAVCGATVLQIACLATSAFLDAEALLEQPLDLQLRQADGTQRHWQGLCTEVAQLGGDGGLARYRLTLEPWTALLQLRRNALVFQDLDARAICERIFADYPQAAFRFDVQAALPAHPITTQYRETDWAFVTRLLAEAGLAWRYAHAQDEDSEATAATLVIFDPQAQAPDSGTLRFHRSDAAEADDAIGAFGERRGVVPTASTVASWHSEQLRAVAAQAQAQAQAESETGALPPLEVYVQPRAGRFAQQATAQEQAQARLDALRVPHTLHAGAGSARVLAAGAAFTLRQHAQYDGQRFVPVAIEHVAVNNLGQGIVALLDAPDLEHGSYRNRFLAVPAATPLRALPQDRPRMPGPQSARVVGVADAALSPSRDHQVRIQFPWQRGAQPTPGGLTDSASAAPGHAPGDQRAGTWVPVAEWVAGPNWGSHFLPRIGSEVLVEFLHGDIDQPRITGQLYNGEVAPPFGGGLDESASHPGTLSGLHTQSHDGGGTQQWLLDDTPGQLRTRLHTSLADTRLDLGYLVQHSDTARGALRGQGFELASQGWGNVHAAQGLLLSSSARGQGASTALDVAEAVAQLHGAERTAQALHDTLTQQQVPGLDASASVTRLREAIDPQAQGKYTAAVGGQPATKPADGGRDGQAPVERFAEARLLGESPDHIAWTTPASAVAYAGQALQLTVQHDAQLSAGQTLSAVSGQHTALFAQRGPITLIAAAGPVSLQAHTGALELLADQALTVTATDTRIDVLAQHKIVLQAGQTRLTLEGGDITFACPGQFTVKASRHPFLGGEMNVAPLSALPGSLISDFGYDEQFRLVADDGETPLSRCRYRITGNNGDAWEGITDEDGLTERVFTLAPTKLDVEIIGNSDGAEVIT
ncbi:type VI secretion system tip protein VgrG [Xanthomonas citri pv. glycines]|uniref:type VI secretion system Vgr family protein n=1 Tax=Xanthomonas citri TaxID=346 RepID=UPI0008A68DFA|nr:type VI secretion system Vgr family protein [Xanthomonas citri]AOY62919.1 type VI secretion system tip protein VgrG [Xanthomonas citri pv. glycines str. 8ra]QDR45450.1 type VI secretion system tip protein VgrG [Xanthomonas citri pv. glycines]